MKTLSMTKIVVVLALATALFAGFSPAAQARGNTDRLAAAPDAKTEICIVEGANICPPAPFGFIAPCITTSQLAGYECPPVTGDAIDASKNLAVEADTSAKICILEGANICPPGPFGFIAPCITTSQLAGYECPPVTGDVIHASKKLAAAGR